MSNSNPVQADLVIEYMQEFGGITQLQALDDLGVMRLASRISEIKKRGYGIGSETVRRVNRYGKTVAYKRYWIEDEPCGK